MGARSGESSGRDGSSERADRRGSIPECVSDLADLPEALCVKECAAFLRSSPAALRRRGCSRRGSAFCVTKQLEVFSPSDGAPIRLRNEVKEVDWLPLPQAPSPDQVLQGKTTNAL